MLGKSTSCSCNPQTLLMSHYIRWLAGGTTCFPESLWWVIAACGPVLLLLSIAGPLRVCLVNTRMAQGMQWPHGIRSYMRKVKLRYQHVIGSITAMTANLKQITCTKHYK